MGGLRPWSHHKGRNLMVMVQKTQQRMRPDADSNQAWATETDQDSRLLRSETSDES